MLVGRRKVDTEKDLVGRQSPGLFKNKAYLNIFVPPTRFVAGVVEYREEETDMVGFRSRYKVDRQLLGLFGWSVR